MRKWLKSFEGKLESALGVVIKCTFISMPIVTGWTGYMAGSGFGYNKGFIDGRSVQKLETPPPPQIIVPKVEVHPHINLIQLDEEGKLGDPIPVLPAKPDKSAQPHASNYSKPRRSLE